MSVPAFAKLICVSALERVESYILNLAEYFYKSRCSILNLIMNDYKAVLPAIESHAANKPAGTYIYALTFSRNRG